MASFVDTLLEALTPPHCLCAAPEDDLWVDMASLRGLLMGALRRPLSLARAAGPAPAVLAMGALATWVRDGGMDAYVQGVADTLIEMGVTREQEVLDRFLRAAVLDVLAAGPLAPLEAGAARLAAPERLLLDLALRGPALRPSGEGSAPGDLRVAVRRYARALGLLSHPDRGDPRGCTPMGAVMRHLPPELVLPALITLEGLTCTSADDPHRAPREAYHQLFLLGEATLPLHEESPGAALPPTGRSGLRLLRWIRMGLCEEARGPSAAPSSLRVRLSAVGRRALDEALRTPVSPIVRLCTLQHRRLREVALRALLPRRGALSGTSPRLGLAHPESAHVIAEHSALPGPAALRAAASARSVPLSAAPRSAAPPRVEPTAPLRARRASPLGGNAVTPMDALLSPEQLRSALPLQPPLDDAPYDLEALCRAALRDLRINPRFHHIAALLVLRPGADLRGDPEAITAPGTAGDGQGLLLRGGRRALRRLLAELLAMAARAVSGQPLPRVLLELATGKEAATLWLHDNGPGIPVSQRPLVFAERPNAETLPRYLLGGVRRVVEEVFEGRIAIAAPRLGGASFCLTLPRRDQQKAA